MSCLTLGVRSNSKQLPVTPSKQVVATLFATVPRFKLIARGVGIFVGSGGTRLKTWDFGSTGKSQPLDAPFTRRNSGSSPLEQSKNCHKLTWRCLNECQNAGIFLIQLYCPATGLSECCRQE